VSSRPEHLATSFALELEALRVDRGLTMKELSRRSGVSRTYLRDLVSVRSGQGLPSTATVEKLAAALDVEPDHFRLIRARVVLESPRAIDAVYVRLKEARARSTTRSVNAT
jgi:transcriptional regulator with XRE-family HTH domain